MTSFVKAVGVLLVVCCLTSGTSAWGWGWDDWWDDWSDEKPEDCPSRNNETNICSILLEFQFDYCKTKYCCDGNGDSSEESGECERTCYQWSPCTLYYCDEECCEGFERRNGHCVNVSEELECHNGGILKQRRNGRYYCDCPQGFRGRTCERPVCHCHNMGECVVENGLPTCKCSEGFTGPFCENVVCDLECHNGGTCTSNGHDSFCKCPTGYVGELCEEKYTNPESCPAPIYTNDRDICSYQCHSSHDCPDDQVCCNEGSSMICRVPEPKTCTHNGEEYQIGEEFKMDDCTFCTCFEGGYPECYSMMCAPFVCYNNTQPISRPGECCPSCPRKCKYKDQVYPHGTSFMDECNTCRCGDGVVGCTKMACNTHCMYNGQRYDSGTTFDVDCNTCTCEHGRVSCTEKACLTCEYKGAVYADGEPFKDDCNTCTCTQGQVACTLMACMTCEHNGVVYADGVSFKDDCNTCTCSQGRIACTEMDCGPSCTAADGTQYEHGATFYVDCNTCHCDNGMIGCTEMACPCTLACQNGGLCVKNDGIATCSCTPSYSGDLCQNKYENSDKCPEPYASSLETTNACRKQCSNDTGCSKDQVCCNEGCHMICRDAKLPVCTYGGQEYKPGDHWSPDPCTKCHCDESGEMPCAMMDCALPRCPYGQQPVYKPGKCCPECPDVRPTLTCPKQLVVIETPKDSSSIRMTKELTGVKAMSSTGKPLEVKFKPEIAEHCRCGWKVETAVVYLSDGYSEERCRFQYEVIDPHPPVFKSCPEDMYIFEKENITYKKPTYTDNVGIKRKSCDMAPTLTSYPPGLYTFKFEVWDFSYNYASCEFKLSVSKSGTPYEQLPQGLKDRNKGPKVALIVAPIAGLLAILMMIIALLLCCRFRRSREGIQNRQNQSREAYDNHIYAVPNDVKAPDYNTLPPNPPAYHSDTVSMKSDYGYLPPPEYKEVEEVKAPEAYSNPDYATIKSDESTVYDEPKSESTVYDEPKSEGKVSEDLKTEEKM